MDWKRITHEPSGISCEIGRLTWRQKPLVAAMVAEALKPLAQVMGISAVPDEEQLQAKLLQTDSVALVSECLDKLDDATLRPIFAAKIRGVEGLPGVTDGGQLLDEAPDVGFMIWILSQLVRDASLSDEEGKASGSPSMSSSEGTADSGSRAPSTEPEGGPSPSTVTETSREEPSSSRVA